MYMTIIPVTGQWNWLVRQALLSVMNENRERQCNPVGCFVKLMRAVIS